MLTAYLKRERKLIGMLALIAGIFAVTALLYGLPAEPVFYAAVLALAVSAAFFAAGYFSYLRRCAEIERLLFRPQDNYLPLPAAADRLEEDYQQLLLAVCADRAQIAETVHTERRDLADYYTLWAHQVKTPLAAMRLLAQAPGGCDTEALFAELLRVDQYVDMALSYLKLSGGDGDLLFAHHELDALIKSSLRKYARLFILKNISLTFTPTTLTVLTDEKWFCFVLEQLLSNSLKYTPAGGAIRIFADNGVLSVCDNGIGIRPEDLPRVGEKGFTGYNGREDKKASGLGLYLCRMVCDKLGCRMALSSEPGAGTAVQLFFPQKGERPE